jgi:carbonic anhydrase
MKPFTTVSLFILLFFLSGCQSPVHKHQDDKESKQEKAYLIPGLQHGLLQSPINILSGEVQQGKYSITLNFDGQINMVENLGHTVQLDFKPGNTITFAGKTYEFKQIHFHTPSEHLIDGMTFPMEMHVVNMLSASEEHDVPEYLVLAYLFKMGKPDPFIDMFIDLIPHGENQTQEVDLNMISRGITNDNQMKNTMRSFYHYKGSLTTPPYTETVDWYVISTIFEASPEQILRIHEIEGDNARHIQAVYGREVDAN